MAASSRDLWTAYCRGHVLNGCEKNVKNILRGSYKKQNGYVLGIDPSVRATGLALIEWIEGNPILRYSETVRFGADIDVFGCIGGVYKAVLEALNRYESLGVVSLESTVYVQNVQIAHKIGAVRGAAIAAAFQAGWPVFEYAPLRVKQAVSGNGRATKAQVAHMISQHLSLSDLLPYDEADAAAMALCHGWQQAIVV